jgi:hypothetical protein
VSWHDFIAKLVVLDEKGARQPEAQAEPRQEPASGGPAEMQLDDVDFGAVYQRAGVPPARFTAEQAMDALAALPMELPVEARRQALKGVLQAMSKTVGTTPEAVLEDAARKVAALHAESAEITRTVAEFTAAVQAEIALLAEHIQGRHRAIEAARSKELQLTQKCQSEADRLQLVRQLYGLDPGDGATS